MLCQANNSLDYLWGSCNYYLVPAKIYKKNKVIKKEKTKNEDNQAKKG